MLGKICRVVVVKEIIDWSNDRVVADFCEVEFARGIERRVHANGNKGCQESESSEEDERKWSGLVSDGFSSADYSSTYLRLK